MVSTAIAQITTSGVKGLIKANGEDVIGATVTVTHVPTGAVYRSVTNSVGRFTIQGMRAWWSLHGRDFLHWLQNQGNQECNTQTW